MAHRPGDVDENRSVWTADKPPYEPRPPLRQARSAAVVIVGGGFTGISTAYHLARRFPERSVVLVEARQIANGASGRNGGLMLNWINGVHSATAEHARAVFETTRSGIDLVERLIREHRLPVDYRRGGSLDVFTRSRNAEEAARDVERLRAAGLPLEYLSGSALESRLCVAGAMGGVYDPTAGRLDGVGFLRAMRGVIEGLGVIVYEGTPVTAIEEGRTVRVVTPGGELTADAVVLATNAYTPALGYFRRQIVPLHSHVVATRPLSPEERAQTGWTGVDGFADDSDRIAYGSLTAAGALVFGGGSNAAYGYRYGGRTSHPGPGAGAIAAMERKLHGYFPRLGPVPLAHRWTGPVALTMSRVCAMGVTGEHRNVYFAFGYSGHGIALANLAGRVLCDIYSDDDERWRWLPFYMPRLPPTPPEPLCWIGYRAYTALTGKSPRRRPVALGR